MHRFDVDERHSVHIYQGSLVEVQVDALVSSDDNYLSAGGGVSAALAEAAGRDVDRERHRAAQERHLRLGDVVRTSGGGLPCRILYHAVTIEDFRRYMGEPTLRRLVGNLLNCASDDAIHSLGMPALGTGVAGFDIARASEIIIEELLARVVDTPVRHIILALIGNEAQRLFYEQLVRANAPRCAASSLRQFEQQLVSGSSKSAASGVTEPAKDSPREAIDARLAEETGEQFPNLVDKTRLATAPADRPRLVAGLAAFVLRHAEQKDVEQEVLNRPECFGFRGTVEQRLMEFLYLGEKSLRLALGPALFRARDLRRMAEELGEDCELARDPEQLIDLILRAMCFNLLVPPVGLTQHLARVERLILDLESPDPTDATRIAAGVEAAKILEQVLKDILRLYGFYFFGPGFEQKLVRINPGTIRRDGGVARLTLGQARDALLHLEAGVQQDRRLRDRWAQLGRESLTLLPTRLTHEPSGQSIDCGQALANFIRWRNQELVHDGPSARSAPDRRRVREQVEHLRSFLLACRAEGIYPEVVRYEGTFENRNGERFVHFLDERNTERKVRTDEKIDPRRHYYCFATNNPLHLFPVLVPKL
jgi:O-acetyl-ADP-ribose deacetylase (regulator of RNase III)